MARGLAVLLALALLGAPARTDETLIVASIRQYQLAGPSNIHLYLYGLDGTLKKQLTHTAGCNDLDPFFSWDGKTVYFTRKSTSAKTARQAALYQVDLATDAISPQKDYYPFVSTPTEVLKYSFTLPSDSWNVSEKSDCLSTDGLYRITLKPLPPPDADVNPPLQHLLSVRGQPAVDMATFPGFPADEAKDYSGLEQLNGSPFVMGPNFAAVFLVHHLDSTDGDQIWGLDLQSQNWTKMSQNGGTIYHPPGASGVFFAADSLYEPLGKTGKTVNCCYLEWWDNHFKMTKLTPPLSVFYSAAVFHPAKGTPNPGDETLKIGGTEFP
jgi:hypothetical protein